SDLLRLLHRTLHAARTRSEDELGTVGAHQHLPLGGHRLRHREDYLVAAGGADERQGDPGVTAGGLHDRATGRQGTGGHGGVDDGHTDAVLDAVGGIVELELGEHGGAG